MSLPTQECIGCRRTVARDPHTLTPCQSPSSRICSQVRPQQGVRDYPQSRVPAHDLSSSTALPPSGLTPEHPRAAPPHAKHDHFPQCRHGDQSLFFLGSQETILKRRRVFPGQEAIRKQARRHSLSRCPFRQAVAVLGSGRARRGKPLSTPRAPLDSQSSNLSTMLGVSMSVEGRDEPHAGFCSVDKEHLSGLAGRGRTRQACRAYIPNVE